MTIRLKKIICSLLIAAVVLSLHGCPESENTRPHDGTSAPAVEDTDINWQLQAEKVTVDGKKLEESFTFSISGTLPLQYEIKDSIALKLEFMWDDSLGYMNEGEKEYTVFCDIADKHDNQPIYLGTGSIYNKNVNEAYTFSFMLCPEKGCVVMRFGNMTERYVASLDPSTETAEIMTFYREYVHVSNP